MHFRVSLAARRLIQLCLVVSTASVLASAGSISYSSPSSGSTVSSPIHVKATASSSSSIRYMNIYLDGNKAASSSSGSIDKYLSASAGSHRITVQAKDNSGSLFAKTIYVTVGSTSSSSTSSSGSKTYYNIDQMSAWSYCSACAGAGGSGPTASLSQAGSISSPSMDGKSRRFTIKGSTPYANGLWWKQLGRNDSVRHFKYDLYFYLKKPSAAQALEFDVNQSLNGKKYIFGTECSIKGSGTWKVYSASQRWVNTGIPCSRPAAYKWHHLIWEFERTTGGNVKFVAFTLNGTKHYVNRVYAPKSSSAREINVAFQLDGDKYMTDYDAWVDKVKLTYW